VAADKSLLCWGANDQGQLGDGTRTDRAAPMPVEAGAGPPAAPLTDVAAVATGSAHTCAVRSDGAVLCWGAGDQGQLGDGSNSGRALAGAPLVKSGAPLSAVAIAAGAAHTCVAESGGEVWCWGNGERGQLGDGTASGAPTPTAVSSLPAAAAAVAAGGAHSCAALIDGRVFCWGADDQGQLGDGATVDSPTPVAVAALTGAVQVAAGSAHSCARARDGSLWCWGSNRSGQLGDGLALQKSSPQLGRMTCP
jgi:alpha-tubulin suppressor-like RCC1 family protein